MKQDTKNRRDETDGKKERIITRKTSKVIEFITDIFFQHSQNIALRIARRKEKEDDANEREPRKKRE